MYTIVSVHKVLLSEHSVIATSYMEMDKTPRTNSIIQFFMISKHMSYRMILNPVSIYNKKNSI